MFETKVPVEGPGVVFLDDESRRGVGLLTRARLATARARASR